MNNKFTPKAQVALNKCIKHAEKLGHTYIGSEHMMLALLDDESSCASLILNKHSLTSEKMSSVIKEYSGSGSRSSLSPKHMTPRAKNILENSYNLSIRYGNGTIGTEHILMSLIEEKESVAVKLLKKIRIDTVAIHDEVEALLKTRERQGSTGKIGTNTPLLKQYGKNLCEMAKNRKFDPVICREDEIERIIRILSRKTKNNPCLIGEAGVGKTAIIEGLAERIVNGNVPDSIKRKTIISVDLTSMIAGAKYRGDFEDRIKNIISEVIKNKNIILFIDEIHTIVGAGAAEGAIDASNILKPQLARGEIQLIGATTFSEYHKHIEKDSALERRFQPIVVEEPDEESTVSMLEALKERYEEHHSVSIADEAILDCVKLSGKFINDRFFPDKAVDVLDEACVIAANSLKTSDITEQFSNKGVLDFEQDIINAYYTEHENLPLNTMYNKPTVSSEHIKIAISEMCNIPKSMIKKNHDYKEILDKISNSLPGREKEISKVLNTIKRNDLGFSSHDRPRGIFLFVGESGTGKTALATELANNLFVGNSKIVRYDMSEFSEKQSISKLIGAPPGYVGHEDGGGLTEAIRKRPHSLILFDEIEKADKDVLNIILQISDTGYLSDSAGRHVNFKNTVIVMTSNLGCGNPHTLRKLGFVESVTEVAEEFVLDALKKQYTQEFINRFDEIIYFDELSIASLSSIAAKKLEEIKNKVTSMGGNLIYDDSLCEFLSNKTYRKPGGVRALLKEISVTIEKPLIELLISNDSILGNNINITIEDNSVSIRENRSLKI